MTQKKDGRPLTFVLATWYAFIFAAFYLAYGGISIVLSILDRNYSEMGRLIVISIVGLVLISFAFALKELRKWGWYGLVGINMLVVVFYIMTFGTLSADLLTINTVLLVLTLGALYCLFAGGTKRYLFKRG